MLVRSVRSATPTLAAALRRSAAPVLRNDARRSGTSDRCYKDGMRLHDHEGRELRRVFVTVRATEAEALLRMISEAARGVDESRKASEPATGFMFVLDGEGTNLPSADPSVPPLR